MIKTFGTLAVAAVAATVLAAPVAAGAHAVKAPVFKNCAAMNKVYPHGVGKIGAHDHVSSGKPVTNFYRSNRIYAANTARDRDKDKIACEKH